MELECSLIRLSQALTISPASERTAIKKECEQVLCALLELNDTQFNRNPRTAVAIGAFAREIASLLFPQAPEEEAGSDHCPLCGSEILSFEVSPRLPPIRVCEFCYERLLSPLEEIRIGFGLNTD